MTDKKSTAGPSEDTSVYKDSPSLSTIQRSKSDQHLQSAHKREKFRLKTSFSMGEKNLSSDDVGEIELDNALCKNCRSKSEADITTCVAGEIHSSSTDNSGSEMTKDHMTFTEGEVTSAKLTDDVNNLTTVSEEGPVNTNIPYSSKHDDKIFPSFNFGDLRHRKSEQES